MKIVRFCDYDFQKMPKRFTQLCIPNKTYWHCKVIFGTVISLLKLQMKEVLCCFHRFKAHLLFAKDMFKTNILLTAKEPFEHLDHLTES